jgi:aspartyl protease family protein
MTHPKDQITPGKKAGKYMVIAAWLLILGLLSLVFGRWTDFLDNPNKNPETLRTTGQLELHLDANRGGHYLVTGSLNGEPAIFLLDTGATDVVIPYALAEKYGLEPGISMTAMTANGPVKVYSTRIEQLQIGEILLTDVQATLNPGMAGWEEILLGMSALSRLELRHKDGELILIQ